MTDTNDSIRKAFLTCLAVVLTVIAFRVGSFADTPATKTKMELTDGQVVTWQKAKEAASEIHDIPVYINYNHQHYICNVSILSNSKLEEIRTKYTDNEGNPPDCTIKKGTVSKDEFLDACENDLQIKNSDLFVTSLEYDESENLKLVEFTYKE